MVPLAEISQVLVFKGGHLLVIRLAVVGVFLFCSFSASADFQWSDNSTWNRARVIAPSQNSWSFRTSYQTYDSRFNSSGQIQDLGRPFDRTWRWNQILSSETSAAAKKDFQDYMTKNGFSSND